LAEAGYADGFFDAVSIWHVLEHVHEPFVTLDDIARVTCNGGLLAIAVPNFSSWQSKLFKSAWFHLDLPRHLYHFDVHSLTRALTTRGYQVSSMSTCSFEQNVFGFIQSLMNKMHFLGKPNEFYQLLKKRSGIQETLKLLFWAALAGLILPFALLEYLLSCLFKKGASVIIFAHKAKN
jgi:2-polyprenyl-3-methyl-5-hydroxy-6-metoxy-1,4-benzoquinol methylase